MSRIAIVAFLAALACAACGGGGPGGTNPSTVAENTNAPPPERYEPPPLPSPAAEAAGSGSGMSPEDPVSACGPVDSYAYVAQRFRCPDGTNPLGGDVEAGRDARVGNVGANSSGHIIDLYRVPCPGGPVDIYVDMYGCPEMLGGE
ncbi:MAG: hypothetical protein AB7S26_35085 [Sandaracinaceae bacterium]